MSRIYHAARVESIERVFFMAVTSYAIGTTNPPTELATLGVPNPYPATFAPFTRSIGMNGQGAQVTTGFPVAAWRWDWLLFSEFQELLDLFSGANSLACYIYTRTDDGTFACYSCVAWRPTSQTMQGGRRGNVEMQFKMLTEVTLAT